MTISVWTVFAASVVAGIMLQLIGVKLSRRPFGFGNSGGALIGTFILFAVCLRLMVVVSLKVPTPLSYPLWFILCLWTASAAAALPAILFEIVRRR